MFVGGAGNFLIVPRPLFFLIFIWDREGQALALRRKRSLPLNVGQGPVPCHALGLSNACEGQALALREKRRVLSRGTGPRATEKTESPFNRRAGACPLPCLGVIERLRGTGPRATVNKARSFARDRPSRYGENGISWLNVGQGPVPCQSSGLSNACEGQALALR